MPVTVKQATDAMPSDRISSGSGAGQALRDNAPLLPEGYVRAAAVEHDGDFDSWAAAKTARIQGLIEHHLPMQASASQRLAEAMHYAAALGGKRMRPLLLWAAGECFDADPVAMDAAACAVELVHAYSLVHDDLPCMDDDVLRRGQPTAHVKFGEAMALLAGDALQTRAFEILVSNPAIPAQTQARLCGLLATAAGASGMAGGQALDLAATGNALGVEALSEMHRRKTGALLKASVMMGLACRQPGSFAPEHEVHGAAILSRYADAIGLAFQVVDDVLDACADSATLGKTAGKDARQSKATFVTALGLQAAQDWAQRLLDDALAALDALPSQQRSRATYLAELARRIVVRSH